MSSTAPTLFHDTEAVAPGALIEARDAIWKVRRVTQAGRARRIECVGASGIMRGKSAVLLDALESDMRVLDPAGVDLVADRSPGYEDARLFLEASFRSTAPVGEVPVVTGRAAIRDLPFQHTPVEMILRQSRPRILIADDVGLGKTLEAGLVASELVLRQRASRILVVTTRAMLLQFQKEFWTRFSIPLARLDSAAIRRIRDRLPAHYNVFERFDRAIVSIDTLKRDLEYRDALEATWWDLVVIDEAHNAADRSAASGTKAARAALAERLSRRANALVLLTATPHDGSQSSFASLVKMLDPTRVPNPEEVRRKDIEDLVVRRFRSSPEVKRDLDAAVKARRLTRRSFPLSPAEEAAYACLAELRLDADEAAGRRRGLDLFRTSLAKALFSSPAACLETLEQRRKRIAAGTAKGSQEDVAALGALSALVRAIGPAEFSKYNDFLAALREIGWTGGDSRDRIVVFSERIATLRWLAERLAADLKLPDKALARVDGSNIEADENALDVLQDFGQEGSPLRILLASDIASEGLNLHFQCHRLFHFDLPWSLLRFQQRNGRIDRYGQDRRPEITYFVGESAHPKVRDMWVLEALVRKDEAAQEGVGDPAVFLGVGDPDLEEEKTAEAVAAGIGAETFERQMDERAAGAGTTAAEDDAWALLFGDYTGPPAEGAEPETPAEPRLCADTFDYAVRMLRRLAAPDQKVLDAPPAVDEGQRLVSFRVPDEMRAVDDFGYARSGEVDEALMPAEAVDGDRIVLTDDAAVIDTAVKNALGADKPWPTVQYLWDVHPLVGWLNDRAQMLFGRFCAPVVRLSGRMPEGEAAVVLHGSVPNRAGALVVDAWGVVKVRRRGASVEAGEVEDLAAFLGAVGFAGQVPNRGDADPAGMAPLVGHAVGVFQAHLVALREARKAELAAHQNEVLERLKAYERRFASQLALDFGDVDEASQSLTARRKRRRRDERRAEVERMFGDWERWVQETSALGEEEHPFVEVKAVFQG